MLRIFLVSAFAFCTTPVVANNVIEPIEFGLNASELIGENVTVAECRVVQMTLKSGRCLIKSQGSTVGDYWFDTAGMPKDVVSRLVTNCANMKANPEHCLTRPTGTVKTKHKRIRLYEVSMEFLRAD